jgi:mannan polymerase II complex MNN10 subunit
MRGLGINGYPSFSTQNQGFFTRHMRRISSSLPRFSSNVPFAEKEKLGRGRWSLQNVPLLGRIQAILARMGRKMKIRLLIGFLLLFIVFIFYQTRASPFQSVP